MKTLLSAVVTAMLALAAIHAHADGMPGERQVSLVIESKTLADALDEWAKQTGFQIVVQNWSLAKSLGAPNLRGKFSAQVALERLLAGTPLTYVWTTDNVVSIREKSPVVPAALQSSGAEQKQATVPIARFSGDGSEQTFSANDQAAIGRNSSTHRGAEPTGDDLEELEEILVTGTHIRGGDSTAPLTTYSREFIERQGYLSTQDFVRSLPQNFKGGENGPSEDGYINSRNGLTNLESGSSVNLRGLGSSSTLVLLNGHRVAPSAYGSAVDISAFPLDAIERVEIMTDGASAIYGADAVGGVVNFILRRDYVGAETAVSGSTTTEGGRAERIVGQTLGTHWNRGGGLISVQYHDADHLGVEDRSFTSTVPVPTDLYPSSEQYSGIVTLNQQITQRANASLDVLYGEERVARNYTDEFASQDSRSDVTSLTSNLTLGYDFATNWRLEANALYSEVDTDVRIFFDPPQSDLFGGPVYVNGAPYVQNNFGLAEFTTKADGTLATLNGHDLKAAVGAAYRDEDFSSFVPWLATDRPFRRSVRAAFAELQFALIHPDQQLTFARRLNLDAAVRYEEYSDFGSTTNPKFGISWSPIETLTMRSAIGTSFRAPTAYEQTTNVANQFLLTQSGFAFPNGDVGNALLLTASTDLKPEKSRDFTLGLNWSPTDDWSLRANYFRIQYEDRLVTPPFDTSVFLHPEIYGPLVTSFTDDAAAAAYVASFAAQGFQFVDLTDSGTGIAGVRYAYQNGLTNASVVRIRGLDLAIDHRKEMSAGTLAFRLDSTVIERIRTAFCDDCTSTDLVDTYGEPLHLRVRAGASWTRQQWQVNGALNYANDYKDTSSVPVGRVDSFVTADVNFRYSPAWLESGQLGLSILNVFNEDPPRTSTGVAFSGLHYDSANADPLGRVISVQLRKSW